MNHMHTLRTTKPNDTSSNVSTPVGEACQWAVQRIAELEAELEKNHDAAKLR